MNTFPLTRLPDSELQQVLLKFSLSSLIQLSTVSKKSKENVKKLPKRKWIGMKIRTQNFYSIEIGTIDHFLERWEKCTVSINNYQSREEYKGFHLQRMTENVGELRDGYHPYHGEYEEKNIHFNDYIVAAVSYNSSIRTFWESPIEGLMFMAEYISDIFNCDPINGLVMGNEQLEDRRILFNWIKNRKSSEVEKFYICPFHGTINDDDIAYVFNNINVTKSLIMEHIPTDTFRQACFNNIKYFRCYDSHWITLNNLITMRLKVSILYDAKLTNKDLSVLVRHWLIGGLPTLEYLQIELKHFVMNDVLNGINHKYKLSTQERKYKYFRSDEAVFGMNNSYDIVRNDGVTATIGYNGGGLHEHYFQMLILRD